jgi:hypothetical protein
MQVLLRLFVIVFEHLLTADQEARLKTGMRIHYSSCIMAVHMVILQATKVQLLVLETYDHLWAEVQENCEEN